MTVETQAVTPPAQYQGEDWDTLTRDAIEVFGADLEKGAQLVGMPMCIVQATYRPGIMNKDNGEMMFYMSLDTIIAPERELDKAFKRGRITQEQRDSFEPGEHLVFNEGGTGVYRQVTALLEATNRIKIKSDLPREGAYGESRFDISPKQWDVDESAEFRLDESGNPTLAFSVRILCPRGLRTSEYPNEFSPSGKAETRYIG